MWGKFWWVVWIYSVLTPRVRGQRASWTFLFRARRCGWFYVALRHLWSNIVTTSQVSAGAVSLTVFASFPRVLLGVTYPLPITHYHTSGSVCVMWASLQDTHTHLRRCRETGQVRILSIPKTDNLIVLLKRHIGRWGSQKILEIVSYRDAHLFKAREMRVTSFTSRHCSV